MAAEDSKGWTQVARLALLTEPSHQPNASVLKQEVGLSFQFSLLSSRSPVGINTVFVLVLLLLVLALKG